MEQGRLARIFIEECEYAVKKPLDTFVDSFQPGMFLQPAFLVIAAVGYIFQNLLLDLVTSFRRIPARLLARWLVETATEADNTKCVTLRDAKKYAAELALGAVLELSGGGPPPALKLAARTGALKGFRRRIIGLEERQMVGKIQHKLIAIIRAPAAFILRVVILVWQIFVAVLGIGCVFAVYNIVVSDWDKVALSQAHPRKRERVKINRRL